jgi:hypothetical protein
VKFNLTAVIYMKKKPNSRFLVKFDLTAMIYAEETEIMFFREIWPDDHDLARKTKFFFHEIWRDGQKLPENNQHYVFSWNLTWRPWFSAKKQKLRLFMKFDPTAMI